MIQSLPSMAGMEKWFARVDRSKPQFALHRGQLDVRPPTAIVQGGINELTSGGLGYGRALAPFIEAVECDLEQRRGLERSGHATVVTHGIMGALSSLFRAILRRGQEVLVPRPLWPGISSNVSKVCAVPIAYAFQTDDDAQSIVANVTKLLTPNTTAIVVNAPSNPAGVSLRSEQANSLVQLANKHDITVIVDDAYESFQPDSVDVTSILLAAKRAFLLCSFSKRFAAPALRLGTIRCRDSYADELWESVILQTGGVSKIVQAAGLTLLESGSGFAEEIIDVLRNRRVSLVKKLGPSRLVNMGNGAGMYILGRSPPGLTGYQFAERLLNLGIGVVPGEVFGCPDSVRISLVEREQKFPDIANRYNDVFRAPG